METQSSFWPSLDRFDDSELAESDNERREFDSQIREKLGTKQDHVEESIEETPARPLTRAQIARKIGEKSRPHVNATIEHFAADPIQSEGSVVITNPISNVSTPLRSGILVAASPAFTPYNTRSSILSATQVLSPQDAAPPLRRPRTLATPSHVESPLASTSQAATSPTPSAYMPLRKASNGSSLQPLSAHHALVAEAIKEKPRIKGVSKGPLSGMVFFFPGLEERVTKRKIDKQKAKLWYGVILEAAGQIAPDFSLEAGVTHIVWEDGSRTILCGHLGLRSLDELPDTICVVKTSFISECKREKCARPIAPHLSFPLARAKERKLVPLNTTGVANRTVDITYQFRSASNSRRRSPSEESTDSLRHKTTRTMSPAEIQQIADELIPDQQRSNITSAVATSHQAASGPGWDQQQSPSKADGLDMMIAGLVKGTVQDVESDYGSETEDDPDPTELTAKRRKLIADGRKKLNQDAEDAGGPFKCMQKNDGQASGSSDGPNEFIAKKLDEMHELYEAAIGKNQFSKQAYRKAAGIMRRTLIPIRTKAEAMELKGIGDSLASRIEEIATNNPFGRAYYEDTASSRSVQLFKGIYGVGATRAHELYEMGARSLDDLRTGRYGLTHGQEIGLHLYHDLQQRIPRAECQALFNQIQSLVHKIDPKVEVEIMGSYRRGANDSGDVDILLTRDTSDGKTHAGVLPTLLQWLFRKRIFTHSLSEPTDGNALEVKWMGVAVADPDDPDRVHRRVDILCIPFEQRGAALIYFTGNDVFNRSLRLYARKNGYSLNQRGLYKGVIRNRVNQQKETEGVLVASRTEQEIFDVLGIRWRPPHHRRP